MEPEPLNPHMLTEFNMQPDEDILFQLANNRYDILQRTNEDLVYCIMLINMHMMIFHKLFDGEDLTGQIEYINGDAFRSNEQDLLISADMVKTMKPVMDTITGELERRATTNEAFKTSAAALYQDSVTFYTFKHNIVK